MAAPTVTSITPQAGSIYGGTSVVIIGTNFNVSGLTVRFGDQLAASVTINSATQLTVVSPAVLNDVEADVIVATDDGQAPVPPSARFYYYNPVPSPAYINKNIFFDPDASYVFYGDVVFAKDPLFASSPGGGSGPVTGAVNLGSGLGLFASEVSGVLGFKSLIAGAGITLTPSGTSMTITAAGAANAWLLTGNAAAGPAVFGTTTDEPISFEANSVQYMLFDVATQRLEVTSDNFQVAAGTLISMAAPTVAINGSVGVGLGTSGTPPVVIGASGASLDVDSSTIRLNGLTSATATSAVLFNSGTKAISYSAVQSPLQVVVQTFYSPGTFTYTPTAGMKYCIIQCRAGGGSGGGAAFPGAAAGGGAGGYAEGVFSAATIGASQTVVIGSGGAIVTNSVGNSGTSSNVGSLLSATAGAGGAVATGANGGGGGAGTGGYLQSFGAQGSPGFIIGSTYFGGSGGGTPEAISYIFASASNVVGVSAELGAGGSGSISVSSNTASGAGGSGFVIIQEFI